MARMIFVNLPVRDVAKATAFYEALGFTKNEQFSGEHASSMVWSDTITVMVLAHDFYRTFLPEGKTIADGAAVSEVLLCLSLDSRAEVDALTEAAAEAGGRADIRPAQDMGFMYNRAFEDLDGHIYEIVFMDMEAARAAMSGGGEPVAG
jgi:uncharacterized protein